MRNQMCDGLPPLSPLPGSEWSLDLHPLVGSLTLGPRCALGPFPGPGSLFLSAPAALGAVFCVQSINSFGICDDLT